MDWKIISNVDVGRERIVDGEWRVEENEKEIMIIVKSNGKVRSIPVTSATAPDSYESIAEMAIIEING